MNATNQTQLTFADDDESTDEDEIECACEYGDPGCFAHYEIEDED